MKYYQVAPLTHLTNNNGLLTYGSESELSAGDIVTVPLRNGKKNAIVIDSVGKPDFEVKTVTIKLSDTPVLDQDRILLAHYIAEQYLCTLGEAFAAMLPVTFGKNRRKIQGSDHIKELERPHTLTEKQNEVLTSIVSQGPLKPHLLFGVTGSGKTEVYMQLITQLLETGKGVIVLVPEISLTPQTLSRFKDRFGDTVALLHSGLKETDKFDQWSRIQNGEKRVVIGARSALFAPVKDLGAIIVDEAHESSYKQDSTPRYQAITVAEKLSKITGSYLILGTASPTITQMYKAKNGDYTLHLLDNRIVQTNMPLVNIVDMRNEFQYGNRSILSEELQASIKEAISKREQVLLFLNRRGMSTFISCRECGYVVKCPNCEIPLTFHYDDLSLRCHHCEHKQIAPTICPVCKSLAIKYFGSGTQKIEAEIYRLIGKDVRIARMDSDTTETRDAHSQIFESIKSGQVDVIVGTQMIAKGWDLGNISLVGIISADSMINLPDFAAEERAFSLMLQVAGRTGRGSSQGKVIVQTYSPDLDIFKYLVKHDYMGFYEKTIAERQEHLYPPFAKIINLLYNDAIEANAKKVSLELATKLSSELSSANISFKLLGPTPGFIPKLRSKYRWQITLKLLDMKEEEINILNNIITHLSTDGWTIDVEPNGI